MKIQKRQDFEFEAIRKQLPKLRELSTHTKPKNLWQLEAAVREKLKALNQLRAHAPRGFDEVHKNYVRLLEELSRRILDDYNLKHNTSFRFEEVVRGKFRAYLNAGVLSV